MKPIKIVMSAFGSYANKTEISFEEINNGIFLIAGDTGAGKTTIFDAITYALYEQTSGGVRDGNMMRSQFADGDTLTYVELTFKYQDEIYIIKRNPQYERRAKRKTADGSGFTTEAPKVELILPDGRTFMGNKTETNNKIVGILGIDKEQFTQIAMIAQGDFLKLLHANSDERKKIFSKIFDTRIYNKIQEVLQNKIREINTELAKNKNLCEHELTNIVHLDESIYKEQWKDIIFGFEFKTDGVLELLEKINSEIIEREDNISINKEKVQASLNEIITSINNAETINQLLAKLKLSNDAKKDLDSMLEEHKIKVKKLDSAKKAERVIPDENRYNDKKTSLASVSERINTINKWLEENEKRLNLLSKQLDDCQKNKEENEEKFTQRITRIEDTLGKYDELEGKTATHIELENKKNILEQNIAKLKNDLESKKILKLKLEEEQNSLKNCYKEYTDAQLKVNQVEKSALELNELNKLKDELSFVKDRYDISIEKADYAFRVYSNTNNKYEQLYKAFLSEQAGILAKERLKENMPCPVCGSTHHPNVASISDHAPTQADVEIAKEERDIREKENSSASEKLQASKQLYEMKLEIVLNKARQLIKDDFSNNPFDLSLINEALENSIKELKLSKDKLAASINNKNRFEANIKALDIIASELTAITVKIDEIVNLHMEVKQRHTAVATSIEEIKKQLLFQTKGEAVLCLNKYKANLEAQNNAVTNATNSFNNLLSSINSKKGQHSSECDNQNRITIELEDAKKTYYNSITANDFVNEEEYKKSRLTSMQMELLQADVDDYNKRLWDINNQVRIYTEQAEGKSEVALDSMINTKQELAFELQKIDKEFKAVYALDKKNFDAKISIEKLFKDRKSIIAQYEIYNSLNATANGNISKSIKMDFETYIQRQYFNRIIAAANKRLNIMTSGQFLLQCREITDLGNRGPVGLDLDVYSLLTDTTRDIKTLSGGESFMAALSMALGLSDVIQSAAGAVHLDTMFIDEGFGSLDDSSRAQAIGVLNELAGNNRLVGIISHVNELKEQIDNKLIVKKGEKGSKVYWAQ